jgi:hypothetical protein
MKPTRTSVAGLWLACLVAGTALAKERVSVLTDISNEPDDEESMVRFLVYAIMEGDTPSFLGLIDHGLGWHVSPAYGGWGGRYALYHAYGETRPIWTNNQDSRDTVTADNGQTVTSDPATVWRWREHFQHDFAARMDWCVAGDFKKANHNPVAVLNGDTSKGVLELTAKPGETVRLSATGSKDPDGDAFTVTWFIYREAGTFPGEVKLTATSGDTTSLVIPAQDPKGPKNATVHVILRLEDRGTPSLFACRRAIIELRP